MTLPTQFNFYIQGNRVVVFFFFAQFKTHSLLTVSEEATLQNTDTEDDKLSGEMDSWSLYEHVLHSLWQQRRP